MMEKQSATTLVELMIVVCILGFLSAIAFANIQGYRNKAQQYLCIANLRQLDGLVSVWAIDNGKQTGDVVQMTDIIPAYLKSTPYCPLDVNKVGYTLTAVSEKPVCPRAPDTHYID